MCRRRSGGEVEIIDLATGKLTGQVKTATGEMIRLALPEALAAQIEREARAAFPARMLRADRRRVGRR